VANTGILVRFRFLTGTKASGLPRTVRISRRRKAIVALATGAILYLIFHVSLVVASECSRVLRDPLYGDKELKLTRLEKSLPPGTPLLLFIGTSRTGNGFAAGQAQEALTDGLGHQVAAFNWGIPASGPVNQLLHLRRILKDGHRPSHLMIEVFPSSYATVPGDTCAYEVRFTEGANLDWSELDWIGEHGIPTERLREERELVPIAPWYALRFRILGRLRPNLVPYHLRYDWSRAPDPNGWTPMVFENLTDEEIAVGNKRTKEEYGSVLANMKFNEASIRGLREMLDLARNEAIPVALVRLPEGTLLRNMYPPGVAAQFERFFAQLATEYNCKLIDTSDWMSDDLFMDGCHLLRNGGGIYTERLVRESILPFMLFSPGSPR
jgi:hypothetical protein